MKLTATQKASTKRWGDDAWWARYGPRLVQWARQYDWSLAKIARSLGVSRVAVLHWKQGERHISLQYRERLLAILWDDFFRSCD